MGGSEIKPILPTEEIICPYCPLSPIINNFLNEEGRLTTEYRCPNLHYGYIPFEDLFKNQHKHGNVCSICKKEANNLDAKKKGIKCEEELLYCGTCKEYICNKCRPKHDKEKESHKILVEKSKVNYTCLEHNKCFYSFCFSCLTDACPDCKRHENHVIKTFDVLIKEFSLDSYKYMLEKYEGYIKSFKRITYLNPELFEVFKKRNKILLNFLSYIYQHFEYKKKMNQLNSEIIINLLNILDHDYETPQEVKDKNKDAFEKYCKNHLILKYKPISYICNFSKNKQDFKISRTELTEYYALESKPAKDKPINFKYSPIGDLIIFSIEENIYILSPKNTENKINKITFPEKVYSFNIHNRNILSISFQTSETVFYRLTPQFPYEEKDDTLPKVESPSEDLVIQIVGNFDKYIVSRTLGGKINLHSDEKKKGNFEIIASDNINYSNNGGSNMYELKAIWKKYVVIKDNDYIVVRDLTKKNLDVFQKQKLLDKTKETHFIVFNGNIIT